MGFDRKRRFTLTVWLMSKTQRRVTLRDIANRVGFHFTTVSMALRGDLSLPEHTREKIRRTAEEMGYAPDPMLQALASYRQTRKPPLQHTPLAWLSCDSHSEFHSDTYLFATYLNGARRRARQFGYRIEEFLLGTPDMTPERMQTILTSRGIAGLIIPPQPHTQQSGEIRMDWSPFSAVAFGYSLAWPPLHLVTNHHSHATRMAVRKLAELGHRRIGLYISKTGNLRTGGGWPGGFAGALFEDSRLAWIPPLLFEGTTEDIAEFTAWKRANRLDAVITSPFFIRRILDAGNVRIPKSLSLVALRVQPENDLIAGVNQHDEEIGVTAVDILLGLLRANERGLPEIPRSILIEGSWQEGKTVQKRKNPAPISR